MRRSKAGAHEEGFALLLVLIGLAVIALVVAAVVDGARRYANEAETDVALVQLRAAVNNADATAERDIAESGIVMAPVLNHAEIFIVGGIPVTVSARPESSKIDINAADVSRLRSLLLVSGFSADRAARLADQIADWRDADSEKRPLGAETADYLMAGRAYGAANRPFASVSELSLLLDGTPDLVTCLAPDVTVFTRRADVDFTQASDRVRAVVAPSASPDAGTGAPLQSVVAGRAVAAGGIYEFDAKAKVGMPTGTIYSLRSIVRVTGDSQRPIWLLSRQSPIPSREDSDRACTRAAQAPLSSS